MCSRFELTSPAARIVDRFGLRVPPVMPNRGVVRPTDLALVVLPGGRAEVRPWGLAVDWSRRPVINARAESLSAKPTFRGLLERRVLVPADRYTEWRTAAGGAKIPCHIGRADGGLLALAGLCDAQGRLVVVTCAPAPAIAHVHDRMPVILAAAGEAAWLDPAVPFDAAAGFLVPITDALEVAEDAPPQGDLFG